jgi:hypothetical protein
MRYVRLIMTAALALFLSCNTADLARLIKNVNLEKKGIHVKLNRVPRGLYQKPFIISFDKMLSDVSNGVVRIKAFNIFTVGNYEKLSPQSIKDVTNFLDPTCKFKDTWFGVYIIMDDKEALGKKFILKDPAGKPDDIRNLKDGSLLMLPELDQKIIFWSSHQHQGYYTWERCNREFHFDERKGTRLTSGTITDKQGRSWYKITGTFDTLAALTDTSKAKMSLFTSIRSYIGLPNKEVYALVTPWHNLIINGSIIARYFRCNDMAFWAVVYYNGGAYTNRKGAPVDNWEKTDLRAVLEKMFDNLEIDCIQQ